MSDAVQTCAREPITTRRATQIEGTIVMIGGIESPVFRHTVPVFVESDGEPAITYRCCIMGSERARDLAAHLFRHVCLEGFAEWLCDARGEWKINLLVIESVRPL